MPQSIPPGLAREHVLQAVAEMGLGTEHPFGSPTGYELVHDGKRYAPKAAVGLAGRHLLGRVLGPEEFSGGEAPGQANFVLRKLGFTVVRKAEGVENEADQPARSSWSEEEVRLIVSDYFEMLEKELLGRPLNMSEHRKALCPRLGGRSSGSIEFKHANISAVLAGQGLPYIYGYKPRGNYKTLLSEAVDAFLDRNPGFLARLADAPTVVTGNAPSTASLDLDSVVEDPPEGIVAVTPAGKPWLSRRGWRTDFVERDARNRELGRMGEEFVVQMERHRLTQVGRADLAGRVEWVAQTVGDGLGFDVLSFDDADESERLVEVKTTGLGKYHPFLLTATELRCSEDVGDRFQLFRVFPYPAGVRPRRPDPRALPARADLVPGNGLKIRRWSRRTRRLLSLPSGRGVWGRFQHRLPPLYLKAMTGAGRRARW